MWGDDDHDDWRDEQETLWRIQAYAQYLDRSLEWWELDAMLGVEAAPR